MKLNPIDIAVCGLSGEEGESGVSLIPETSVVLPDYYALVDDHDAEGGVWRMKWKDWVDLAGQILDVDMVRRAKDQEDGL